MADDGDSAGSDDFELAPFVAQVAQRSAAMLARRMPEELSSHEPHSLLLAYFSVAAGDIIRLDGMPTGDARLAVAVLSHLDSSGGAFAGVPTDASNIVATHCALHVLATTGYLRDACDRDRAAARRLPRVIDPPAVLAFLHSCRRSDGSVAAYPGSAEVDVRFAYSAAVVLYLLREIVGVGVADPSAWAVTQQWVASCQLLDGGFGGAPHVAESHAGMTYCAVAACLLLAADTRPEVALADAGVAVADLIANLAHRQWPRTGGMSSGGVAGRCGKPADCCYAWWVGATAAALRRDDVLDAEALGVHVLSCRDEPGGFAKYPIATADPQHTYMGLAGLTLAAHRAAASGTTDVRLAEAATLVRAVHPLFGVAEERVAAGWPDAA